MSASPRPVIRTFASLAAGLLTLVAAVVSAPAVHALAAAPAAAGSWHIPVGPHPDGACGWD